MAIFKSCADGFRINTKDKRVYIVQKNKTGQRKRDKIPDKHASIANERNRWADLKNNDAESTKKKWNPFLKAQ